MIRELFRTEKRDVVIVQDRDVPGQRGAAQLAIGHSPIRQDHHAAEGERRPRMEGNGRYGGAL